MDTGAAILDFGGEFGQNAVGKPMSNDGPDLSANNLRANKVTPYVKQGTPSEVINAVSGGPMTNGSSENEANEE